mgnify:CR=1 FL=1
MVGDFLWALVDISVRFSRVTLIVILVFLMALPIPLFDVRTVGEKVDPGVTQGAERLRPTVFSVEEDTSSLMLTISVGEYKVGKDSLEFDENIPITLDGLPILLSIVKLFIVADDKRIEGAVIVQDETATIDFAPKIHVPIPRKEQK